MAVVQTKYGGVSTAFPERYVKDQLVPTAKPSIPISEGRVTKDGRRSTLETPTPSAETLVGTPEQKEQQIQQYRQPLTISNQFTTETKRLPSGEVISSVGVPPQRLPGVKVTDEVPRKTGQIDEYFTQDGKLYRRTSELYSGGGKIEVGFGVFGDTSQYIEYQNPLGTTSTVKVSKGETIYYNPAGGYGATPSKTVPEGSYEVNIKGERLFGGQTAEQIYQEKYQQASYLGKVKIGLVSAATPENPFNVPSFTDYGVKTGSQANILKALSLVGGKKTEKERIQTTLTTSLYESSGQTPKTFKEFTTRSPLFYGGVVAPIGGLAISGGLAVAGTLGMPVLAKYGPQTFMIGTRIFTSPSVSTTVLPTLATGVEYYEVQRESKILEGGGTIGDVVGDIVVQGVPLATGTAGVVAGAKVFAEPFAVSQPEFTGPMEINKVAIAGRVTPIGNVEKEYAIFGQQEAQFEGSILPPRTRTVYGFLEETQLPGGNVVLRSGSKITRVESAYDFLTGEMKPVSRTFEIGSPIPTTVSKISGISKGSDLLKVSPGELPKIQGSTGTVYLQEVETGKVFSIQGKGVSLGIDEDTYRYIAGVGKKGKITVRGTVIDRLGLQPTREVIESRTEKPLFTFTKDIDRAMKPFDFSEYQKVTRTPKSSLNLPKETKGGTQVLEQIQPSSYYGQGTYERTEGGLLPGQKFRAGGEPSMAAVEKSFSIPEETFRSRIKLPTPSSTFAPTTTTQLRKGLTSFSVNVPTTTQTFRSRLTVSQSPIQTDFQKQIQKQRTEQITQQSDITRQTTTEITSTKSPPFTTMKISPPLPPITFGGVYFNEPYQYKKRKKGKRLRSRYQPSLTSALLGIKAGRIPMRIGGENPFRRPIVLGSKRKSRKKKR